MLQLLRREPILAAEGMLVGRELGACTVGLVGMTPTAKPLAEMLTVFGARVIGYDPGTHPSDPLWTRHRVLPNPLPELMAASDVTCVMLPFYARYQGLISAELLGDIRQDQVFVCLSHSALLDDAALARALAGGRMAAAWLDAAEPGLAAVGRPLHGIDTLMITPRLAGTTRQSRARAAWAVARRIDEVLSGVTERSGFRSTLTGAVPGRAVGPASA
jgi:D-3-phosphoglycerate dehydrogenase